TAFSGITATDKGIHISTEPYVGYGMGVYVADGQGEMTPGVNPGDAEPGGRTFDFAALPGNASHFMNEAGDIAFNGHRVSDPVGQQSAPQAVGIQADTNVYVRHAASGQIETIASLGDPLPGGGTLISGVAAGLNNAG